MTQQINNFETELQVTDAPPEYYRRVAFGLLAERGKLLQQIETAMAVIAANQATNEHLLQESVNLHDRVNELTTANSYLGSEVSRLMIENDSLQAVIKLNARLEN